VQENLGSFGKRKIGVLTSRGDPKGEIIPISPGGGEVSIGGDKRS
jgi:hypothetical protein